MITKRKRFTIPEYREKKEIYELLGYQEVDYKESGVRCHVTFQIDETSKTYHALRKLEKQIFPKGPSFAPILLFLVIAFILLSVFVIALARSFRDGTQFDLVAHALGYILPAFIFLLADVIYTFFYFKINQKILDNYNFSKEFIAEEVEKIKNR